MKSFSLHGPWAAHEVQTRELREHLSREQQECERWRAACAERDEQLAREREKLQQLEATRLPELENQLATAVQTVDQLVADVERQQLATKKAEESGAAAVAVLQSKLEAVIADNAVLKAELTKTLQLRKATHDKVEEARRRLGLSQPEAEFFIHDLDETKASNKSLKAEVAALSADKARLEQQCDSRSSHAMMLIAENKRLLEQVSELRRQLTAADQDLWKARQDLAAAKKVGARAVKKQQDLSTAAQARPEWQGTTSSSTRPALAHSTATASTSGHHAAPCRDVTNHQHSGGNASGSATVGRDQGGAKGAAIGRGGRVAPLHGGKPHVVAEAATVVAVRQAAEQLEELRRAALQQALACRQQRLAHVAASSGPGGS